LQRPLARTTISIPDPNFTHQRCDQLFPVLARCGRTVGRPGRPVIDVNLPNKAFTDDQFVDRDVL
jgi:hypothetical protein